MDVFCQSLVHSGLGGERNGEEKARWKKTTFLCIEMMKVTFASQELIPRLMTSWRRADDLWQYLNVALNLCYLAMVTCINRAACLLAGPACVPSIKHTNVPDLISEASIKFLVKFQCGCFSQS